MKVTNAQIMKEIEVARHIDSIDVIPDPRRIAWLEEAWKELDEGSKNFIKQEFGKSHWINNSKWN